MLFNSLKSLFKDILENDANIVLSFLKNPVFNTDSYKLSHKNMEPDETEFIYSNLTPRFNKYFKRRFPNHDDKIVVFSFQAFIIKEFINAWNTYFFKQPIEEVIEALYLIFFDQNISISRM